MTSPRWFSIAAGLLVLNAMAVITTGFWRHAGADEPPQKSSQFSNPADPSPTNGVTVAGAEGQSPKAGPANPLDAIPIPDALPDIPSLPDPEALQNDPGFQEFRRLFAAEEESWGVEPPLLRKQNAEAHSTAYFAALDQRLETVEKICAAARSIASEAARQAQRGSRDQSADLVRMATQLRDIAAKLLVSEM